MVSLFSMQLVVVAKLGYISFAVEWVWIVPQCCRVLLCIECCGVLEGRGIFGGAAVFFLLLI